MESDPLLPPQEDYNKTAQYAEALRMAGGRLSLKPSAPKADQFGIPRASEEDNLADWYAANPNKIIDLSRSDAKQHWEKLVKGMHNRHVNWMEQIAEVGGEIAKVPAAFIEGVVEEKGNPLTIAASSAEGVVRSVRDLYGMIGESENPTSLLFGFRSAIRAIKSGKISQNWEEEAQQWNETRKFLWDSYKVMNGDMSVYETLPYVNMSEATAQKLRALSNPKIAHAVSFIGLELPSLLTAPFTGGAGVGLAIATAGRQSVMQTAAQAAKASAYSRIMGTLTETGKRLDALASGAALRATGAVATGVSKAISVPANLVEGVIGKNIDALAARGGVSSAQARNITAATAINGMADVGAGEIRQTVGYLGSLGLRTTAELAGEIGEQASLLASGAIPAQAVNGLSVLERVAGNKLLSGSARNAAKFLNVTVDPILQMSTAALKHGYKDAAFFAGLGYMNDRERGAVGGAAMGMVWGGYSGAVRHLWSNINGFVQHERFIKDFDERLLPKLEQGWSPDFASFARKVVADADLGKSSKTSANARMVLQQMHLMLDAKQKKQVIAGTLPAQEMAKVLAARGVVDPMRYLDPRGKGQFSLVRDTSGNIIPLIWLNPEKYRPADFGHEVLSHMAIWNLQTRGQLGTHLIEFFGIKENEGAIPDEKMTEVALRMSLEEALNRKQGMTIEEARQVANEIYNADADTVGSRKYFERAIKEFRSATNFNHFHQTIDINGEQVPAIYGSTRGVKGERQSPIQYIFEEFIGKHAENMFIHTNLQDLVLPPEDKPLRMYFERKYTERLARNQTELELAGVIAKYGAPLTKDGRPTIQAMIYDDGVYYRHPAMDNVLKNMLDAARSVNDGPISNLSPEMQLAVAKKHRKEFLFNIRGNGATLKGEKERNEMSANNARGAFEVIDALPDELKPKITVDEHGNRSADVYTMKDEVIDAMVDGGFLDPESGRVAKVFRDTYMQYESSGFATGNLVYGINIGDSHRTAVGNLFKRIFGDDVPATNRVFVPFELKVYLRTTDGNGKSLRAPRGGFTATVMDYTAIHRRQIKTWSRADVKALWTNIGEFNADFHEYLLNFLKDPANRVDSATLFRAKFGADAEKVRDIMYETFGASKRKDESYLNAPREGYFSSHENPNFPIHSLKLENLIGVERISAAPFPYHHGRSYEPLRRNLSVAGFEEISANMFGNGQGYRVIRERNHDLSGWKVFSPFGGLIGRYKDKDKAFKAAQKHLRKDMDPADVLALPTDEEWSQMNKPERLKRIQEDGQQFRDYHSKRRNSATKASLSVGSVSPNGKSYTPRYKDETSLNAKFKDLLEGKFVSYRDLVDNVKELDVDYRQSNGVTWDLSGVRIVANTFGNKVEAKYVGKGTHIIKHPTNGELVVYADMEYYMGRYRQDYQRKLMEDFESELTQIAEASHKDNITSSYVNVEPSSPRTFLSHRAEGEAIKAVYDAVERGENAPEGVRAEYDRRKQAVESEGFKSAYKADSAKSLEEAINVIAKDPLVPNDLKAHVSLIVGAFRTKNEKNSFAYADQQSGSWRKLKSVLVHARGQFMPEGDVKLIKYFDSNKQLAVGMAGNQSLAFHSAKLKETLLSLTPEQRHGVSVGISKLYAHWAPQIAKFEELAEATDSVRNESLMEASFRTSQGVQTRVAVVAPDYTAKALGSSVQQALFVNAMEGGIGIYSPLGVIFHVPTNAKKSGDMGNIGGTDAGSASPQPMNAMGARNIIDGFPSPAQMDAKAADILRDTYFRPDSLPRKMYLLAADVISRDNSLEPKVIELWKTYLGNGDHANAATALHDLADSVDSQQLRRHAQVVLGLGLATDKNLMTERLYKRFGQLDQAATNNGLEAYWDQAVAEYNIAAQRLWDVGGEKSLIESAHESIMGGEFYRQFGVKDKELEAVRRENRQRHDRFHAIAEKNYNARYNQSVGGVDALRPDRREEVIRSGLAKEIRFGGKNLLVFEFSDADAYLDLSSVQNRPHLLPFAGMPDAEQAFSDYAFEVKRRAADPKSEKYIPFHKQIGKDTTLGKVFGHETMYYYYPEMRDVRVRWVDSHGGFASTLPNGEHLIELGIRSFANSELNMKNDPEGLIFSDRQSATAKHISQNPLASVVLHEAQHVLQYRANMNSEHGHFFNLNKEVTIGHFANLLGLRTNFADGEVISKAMKGNSIWSDADITATKDINALASRIALAKDSPVFRELSGNARPLLKTAVRNLSAFVAAEVDAGRMDESLSRRMLALDRAQDGVQNVQDALATYKEMMAVREELRSKYPSYSAHSHFDVEFRAAISALGLVRSVVAIEKATPQQRKLLIRQAFDDFIDLDYIMAPSERMARETEDRRMLSQDELAKTPRTYTTDALPQGSVLGIVQRAMDSSTVETTKGLMEKQTASFDAFDRGYVSPIKTVMMSIGGIGESKDFADNTAFTLLGKMSLARFFLSKATTEYTNIRRFFIQQKGWEVVDGKMTLVTGNYVVSGDFDSAVKSLAAKFRPDSVETGDRTAYAVSGVAKESGTYTIADIAEIAGIKIESEDILSLGNSVMDKVASDDFPPVFSVKEIKGLLGDYSQESAATVLLDYVVERLNPDRVLTKNDLLNIMAFNHSDMEMLYNVSEANVGINKAKPVTGRPITKEMKMQVLRLYPAAARSKIHRILEASHEGNHSRPFYGRGKQYKYGRFKVSGGQITFEAPHFNEALSAGIPPADVAAFRQRLSKGVSQRIVQHSVSMTKNEAYEIAAQMNDRMVRLSVLMEPVMEKAYEFVVHQNSQSPEKARVLWLSMMEDVEIAALRIAFSDQYSGQRANTTDIYTRIGGMDGTVNATEQAARGLQRVFGETSPASKLRESGGMNQRGRNNSLPVSGLMPSLHMLHGNFLFGSVPAEGFARVESGVTVAPAQAMHFKERRYLGNVSEANQSNQDTGGGLPDYLTGAQHALSEQFKYVHGNWSDGDMGGIMGRMRGYVEAVSKRAENTADMKERLLRIQTGLKMNESRNSIISSEWQGEQMLKKIDALMAEGMSQDEAFASLLNELDRRIEMAKADEADLAEILTMQLDSVSAFANNYGAVIMDKNGMPRTRGGDDAPIEVMTPHRFVMHSSVQAAGTSAIQIKDKTFVDVDLSLAEPDQPTSVVVPAIGVEQGMPSAVQKQMNMTAHAVEGVITGLIGSAVKRDEQMVLSPLRQNPLMLGYLERLNPENQTAQGLGGEMTSNAYVVIGGLMYASHNTFLSYHDMMTAGSRDLIRFATDNLRDQINTDYQTGGIFSNHAMTRNPFLSGKSLNYGVLGLMIAPYLLAHDSLGFPVTSGENILHRSRGIRTEKFLELVDMAKETDMRDQTQAAAFNSKLTEWIGGMDAGYLQRLLYECSSASVIDGVVLRMNMLQMHVLASEHPTRADRLNKANEMGAIHGFDDYFGDSQLYTDGPKGKHPEVNRYMHVRIKESSLNPDMWRGVFFGLAAAKEIETRRPSLHPYVGHGKVRNRSKAYMQGEETMVYGRPMPSNRRSTSEGLDVDSFPVDKYDSESGFGGAYGTTNKRKKISETDIFGLVAGNESTRVHIQSETPVSLFDAIEHHVASVRGAMPVDVEGTSSGVKDSWYTTDISGSVLTPYTVGTGEKTSNVTVQTRKHPLGVVSRRKLLVNRLAAAAEQLGSDEVSVQPARFTSSKRVQAVFKGISNKDRRAEMFYEQDVVPIAFSGQTFVSARYSERDRPSLGFAWKRLEDGRIMLNIAPDTNIGGYLDVSNGTEYSTPLGFSHRRTLGWDVESGVLTPMSPLSIIRRFASTRDNNPIASRSASHMDFIDPMVRAQYEASAKAIARRVYGGANIKSMSKQQLSKYGNKPDAIFDAYQRIMSGDRVMDFDDFTNEDAKIARVLAMAEFSSMASPEDGYVTVILPANATMADIQHAFFTQVAHSNLLLNSERYGVNQKNGAYRRGGISLPADGSPHLNGYTTPTEIASVKSAIENYLAIRIDNRAATRSRPSDFGYADSGAPKSSSSTTQSIQISAQRYGLLMPSVFADLGKLHERMTSSEGGYFMPDVERSIALNGDRSAVIDLIMPNSPHLQRYAWDAQSKANVSIVRKSDKSGYLVGHDVVSGVDRAGNPIKTRKVSAFRTESEAKAHADRVSQGGIEAEIPSILFREGQFRLEDIDPSLAHSRTSGKADVNAGLKFNPEFVSDDAATYDGNDKDIFTTDGTYFVGNIDKTFASRAEAKAAQEMLLRTEAITGKAPSRDRINLSVGDVGVYEHDIRRGLQFAVGGSYIQFAPKALSILRTAMVPMMEKNKSGATKKVKKAVDIATGSEWYEMFMENQVSKAEMRVLGLAEFLYDHKEHKITKQEIAKFIWAMYPTTGRLNHERLQTPYVGNVTSPTVAIRSAAHRLLAERNRHLKTIEAAIESAPEDQKGEMVAYLANIRKMHDDALRSALEQFYEKDRAEMIGSRPDLLENASDISRDALPKRQIADMMLQEFRNFDAITEPVMATYRHLFNDAFARARLEASARLSGFDLAIADFRTSDTNLNEISNWGLAMNTSYHGSRIEPPPSRTVTGKGVQNQVTQADASAYGLQNVDTAPDYVGYTSGLGSYRWDTLYTDLEIQKGENYVRSLKDMANLESDPAKKEALLRQHKSAERIMSVRKSAKGATRNSGHKNTPNGTMQLGHARHSDVIVTAYHRANAPIGEVASSLKLNRDTLAVLGIEELQSDPYQGSTFGPKQDAMLGATFEQVEATSLISEFKMVTDKIADKENARANISAPLGYLTHSAKQKHRDALYNFIARYEWDNGTPLFRYLIARDYLSQNNDTTVTFNHEVRHKISKQVQEQYGMKEDYVPEVVFDLNYDGGVHMRLYEMIHEDMQGSMNPMESDLYSLLYGYGNSEHAGLVGTSTRAMFRYSSNTNPHSLALLIATVGLQFNKEFMAKVDELGQFYELDLDNVQRPPVDYDKVAMETLMDFRRRVEKANPDSLPDGHSMRGNHMLFKQWKSTTLRALRYLELAYYEDGSQIVEFKNKRTSPHVNRGEYHTADTPAEIMSSKMPVILSAARINDYVSSADSYSNGKVKPREAAENAKKILSRIHSGMGHRFLELRPAHQVAFDLRLRAQILGMEPSAFVDLLDRSKYPDGTWPSGSVSKEKAETMRLILTEPDKVTADQLELLDESGHKLIRVTDVDLDPTSGSAFSRSRVSQPAYARTMLGRIFENNAPAIINTYLGHTPDPELDVLKARHNELKAKLGDSIGGDYDFPDTIPLGEDNAYRGVMTNWYAMRALQSRKDALVVMDARHHRARYSSNSNFVTLFNLGGGLIAPIPTGGMKRRTVLAAGYVLHEAKKQKTHGGFIEALHAGQFPDAFLANQASMEWNGVNNNLKTHMRLAASEIVAQMPELTRDSNTSLINAVDSMMDLVLVGDNRYGSDDINNLNKLIASVRSGNMTKERAIKAIEGMTDGKDIAKRIFTHFEKPQGVILNVPIGRTHGYATNYGAPLWHNKLYYSGMQDTLINQVSHDAFDIPDVSMRDGKYVVTDKKTGKVIVEGITSFDEAQERAAQSAKYLGAVPIVSNFLKTFGKMGGYAMEGFMMATNKNESQTSQVLKDTMRPDLIAPYTEMGKTAGMAGAAGMTQRMGSSFGNFPMPDANYMPIEGTNSANRIEAKHGVFGPDMTEDTVNTALEHATALHAMGVRAGADAEQIAAGLHRLGGFTGPMLVIRPKFPTANHMAEAKKAIIQGIPFMSVSGVDKPQVMAKEAARMYKWYAKGAKNQNQYEPRPELN